MSRTEREAAPLEASVLICSRDRPVMLAETVASVLEGRAVPRELLIVDQSAGGHPSLAAGGVVRGCAVRYLPSSTSGLSRARNVGLRAATCDVVVLIDDDMLVEPEWLSRLLTGLQQAGPKGVATGRVLPAPPEGSHGEVPPAALVTLATPAVFRGRQPLDVVPGANVAVHRELVLALGGYDERLGAGTRYSAADDNDMGFRLLEAGCEVRHVPGAVVLHRAWRSGSDLVRLRWDYGRGKGAFYAKHLHRHDNFMFRRLTADVRRRLGKALRAVPSSPSTAAAELVSIGAVLSGTCSWLARERIPVRVTGGRSG
jgi:hypothetical protein